VIGVDEQVAAVQRRGLPAVALSPLTLGAGSLEPELRAMGALFDAAVFYVAPADGGASGTSQASSSAANLAASLFAADSLGELRRVLKPGGRLVVQMPEEGAARESLRQAGFQVASWEAEQPGVCRLVAALA
jgi:hypothetical protein